MLRPNGLKLSTSAHELEISKYPSANDTSEVL